MLLGNRTTCPVEWLGVEPWLCNHESCCCHHATVPCTNQALLLLLHLFNGIFPGQPATWVSQHQKGTPIWILLEQEMMGWQWHQLDHKQIVCTSLQTSNHARTSPLSFYRLDALPAAQPTVSKHWRQSSNICYWLNICDCPWHER